MPKIKILPPSVANMIAAGEVVERPASVVKELIENALDAQAQRIVVEVEKGGKDLIRITDNGVGMDAQDAKMAFVRHATSKIADSSDLNHIQTLGFRGEALASIGAVAYVELKTRAAGNIEATHVCVKGGRIEFAKTTSFAMGTQVEIKHLFINVPARKKFLKGDATEFSHISNTVTYFALGHHEVAFRLVHNGKEVFDLPGAKNLLERIELLLGKGVAKDMLPISYGGEALHLEGYVGIPEQARRSRVHQYIILNGREISDATISKAVMEGYHSLLGVNKYPVFVIKVKIDPRFVDVNVHPRKREVKFVNQSQVFEAVGLSVKTALEKFNLAPTLGYSSTSPFRVSEIGHRPLNEAYSESQSFAAPIVDYGSSARLSGGFSALSQFEKRAISTQASFSQTADTSQMSTAQKRAYLLARRAERLGLQPSGNEVQSALQFTKQISEPVTQTDEITVIAQINNSYIIAQNTEGIVIFDQHAAHERVQYMKLMESIGKGQVLRQQLLTPFQLELSYREMAVFEPALTVLKQVGFDIETFGQRTFSINAIPACLEKDNLAEVMRGILDDLLDERNAAEVYRREEKLLTSIACRSAIKFGRTLTREEMLALLNQLNGLSQKYTCPHGRPTMITLAFDELKRRFGRS